MLNNDISPIGPPATAQEASLLYDPSFRLHETFEDMMAKRENYESENIIFDLADMKACFEYLRLLPRYNSKLKQHPDIFYTPDLSPDESYALAISAIDKVGYDEEGVLRIRNPFKDKEQEALYDATLALVLYAKDNNYPDNALENLNTFVEQITDIN